LTLDDKISWGRGNYKGGWGDTTQKGSLAETRGRANLTRTEKGGIMRQMQQRPEGQKSPKKKEKLC